MKCQLGQHSGADLLSKLRNWDVQIGSPPFRPFLPGPFAICDIYTLLVLSTSNASSKQQIFKTNNESQSYSNSRSNRRKLYCMHYRVPPPTKRSHCFWLHVHNFSVWWTNLSNFWHTNAVLFPRYLLTRWLYCVECPQYSTRQRSASNIHRFGMLRKNR